MNNRVFFLLIKCQIYQLIPFYKHCRRKKVNVQQDLRFNKSFQVKCQDMVELSVLVTFQLFPVIVMKDIDFPMLIINSDLILH